MIALQVAVFTAAAGAATWTIWDAVAGQWDRIAAALRQFQ